MTSSNSTQLDQNTINTQANNHDQMCDTVTNQIKNLRSYIDSTLQASPSAATRALSSTFDDWANSVQTVTVEHLRQMAVEIRAAASGQTSQDEQNTQSILHMPMDTSSFLGVGSL